MSVINQMLVDLERRRASGEERHRIPDHVRALPDEAANTWVNSKTITAALVVAALAFGIGWWMTGRPVMPVAPVIPVAVVPAKVPVAELEAVEFIAQRMSFDLALVPEVINDRPEDKSSATAAPVTAASVIARDAQKAAPAPVKAVAVSEPPPRTVTQSTPNKQVVAAAAPPPVDIQKRVREWTPRQRADIEYAKGAAALHQGLQVEARSAFEAALQVDPNYHSARQALVGIMLDARQLTEVSQLLQEGLQLAPAQYGFAMTLARLQMERGELDAATRTLSRSLEYAGGVPDYIAFYAGLLQRQQKHAEAVVQFSNALQLRANTGVWLLGMGVSLDVLGRRAEAQEAYRRAQATGNLSDELQVFAEQRLR